MVKHLNPVDIGFRQLVANDLSVLHLWLNEPEVSKWWHVNGNHHPPLQLVLQHWQPRLGENNPDVPFIILYGSKPIGYIQRYSITKQADIRHYGLDSGFAGIDLFIGDNEYLHRGIGSFIIINFLKDYVFSFYPVETCIIDPEPENVIAIRAYEKAGFKHYLTIWNPLDKVQAYLMRIERKAICPSTLYPL